MLREIQTLTQYPYTATVHLEVSFPDGALFRGSGAVVGRNDVLTATHVLYNPDHGGWATGIDFHFGVDYNAMQNRYESGSLYDLGSYNWEASGWPGYTFQDNDHVGMTFSEVQGDVALIGLDKAIGDQLGWFELSPGYDEPLWAYQLGYPDGSTGMMQGQAFVSKSSGYDVYSAYYREGSDIMGPGSSGGPLYVMENGVATLIGVKSAGTDTASHWADVGFLYDELAQLIAGNDSMIGGLNLTGSVGNDVFRATNEADIIDGGAGRDTVIYSKAYADYKVSVGDTTTQVANLGKANDTDTLSNIDRLHFGNGTLALDVGGGETAGSAYRLYQAAFDRTPDGSGLGYWIDVMDDGISLSEVAHYFTQSPEFASLYGANPGHDDLLTRLYNNVLDRAPDASGQGYWLEKMDQGLAHSEVLAYFAESPENQIKIQGVVENGIWLEGQYI